MTRILGSVHNYLASIDITEYLRYNLEYERHARSFSRAAYNTVQGQGECPPDRRPGKQGLATEHQAQLGSSPPVSPMQECLGSGSDLLDILKVLRMQ